MGGMEFNKIFAAVLVAGIVASLSGFIGKSLVHPKELEEDAYIIEGDSGGLVGSAQAATPMPDPLLGLLADADVARGEKIAKACMACHTFDKGAPAGVGPNLYGVVGGPKDHMPGYAYSGALLENGGSTWTYAELNKFLWKPKAYAAGTKMNFLGVKKTEDRAALIAWLRSKADAPKPLPSAADIAAEQAALAPPAAEEPAADENESESEAEAPAEPAAH